MLHCTGCSKNYAPYDPSVLEKRSRSFFRIPQIGKRHGDDGGRYSVVVDGELGLVTLWSCDDRVAGAGEDEVAFSACWHPSTDDRVFLNVRKVLQNTTLGSFNLGI